MDHERFRDALHIRIKGFLRRRRGIATRYLDSYLRWFHLIEGVDRQTAPAFCELSQI